MEGNSITKFNPEEIKRKAKAFLALLLCQTIA
jgi:hypothetical protein